MELALPPDAINRVHAAAGALATLDTLVAGRPSLFHITRVLIRDEATRSSAIEGIQATLDELLNADAILEDSERRGASDRTQDELKTVRAYAMALEESLTHPAPIDTAAIQALHRRVFARAEDYVDGRKGRAGAWRDRVVWIGGLHDISRSTFNPPPPEAVPRMMEAHVDWVRRTGEGAAVLATPIRLAMAHAHFEAMHPFADGNGRVGRMLLSLMLAVEGHVPIPLSRYLEANRAAYYEALRAAQQRLDFVPLTLLMCDAIETSARGAEALYRHLSAMPTVWRRDGNWPEGRAPRRDSAANRALDLLPYHPVITTAGFARRLGISAQAAHNAVRLLMGAGMLAERTGWRRNRVFVCREALVAIVGAEAWQVVVGQDHPE